MTVYLGGKWCNWEGLYSVGDFFLINIKMYSIYNPERILSKFLARQG